MVYTEVRNINGKNYYYRVISIRKKEKVSKKRIYLGFDLSSLDLSKKEKIADKQLLFTRMNKINKEIEKLKPKIIKILRENNVDKAGIFGSYSRGEQKDTSDIDIAINIDDKNMSLLGFIGIKLALEKALGKKVDLVEYSAIKHLIKNRILKEEIRII